MTAEFLFKRRPEKTLGFALDDNREIRRPPAGERTSALRDCRKADTERSENAHSKLNQTDPATRRPAHSKNSFALPIRPESSAIFIAEQFARMISPSGDSLRNSPARAKQHKPFRRSGSLKTARILSGDLPFCRIIHEDTSGDDGSRGLRRPPAQKPVGLR